MKRLAIPILNNILSKAFDKCNAYVFFDIEENGTTSSFQKKLPLELNINQIANWFKTQGTTDIVFHHVDTNNLSLFIELKINVFVGVDLLPPELLLEQFTNGRLKSNSKEIN